MIEDSLERIVEEFLELQRSGRSPQIQDYVERYPDLADDLRASLTALAMVEGLKGQGTEVEDIPDQGATTVPDRIGDYRILEKVGRGGMGVVYRAEHQTLGRQVALKVLLQHSVGDENARARFQREAREAARMHHTNIVPVYEVGEDDGRCFYAMQLINGASLDLVIDELDRVCHTDATRKEHGSKAAGDGSISTAVETRVLVEPLILDRTVSPKADSFGRQGETQDEQRVSEQSAVVSHHRGSSSRNARRRYCDAVARIGLQVAKALQYAHSRGLIHRDIKPSNLILDGSETVWITDFGLAKTEDDGLTRTGDHPGTIRYMSPERFRGSCGPCADTYALGLVLYELLTLRPAFDSMDRLQLMDEIVNSEPASPSSVDRNIPVDLETIVLKSIEKSCDSRYATAGEMGDDLQRFLNDEPIRARPISTLERLSRWRRRNRPLAIALTTIASLLIIGFFASVMVASYYRQMADAQRTLKEAAIEERETAKENLYAAQISLASADLGLNKTLSAQAILASAAQRPGIPEWEWHYLQRYLNGELLRWTDHDEEFNEVRLATLPELGLIVSTASTPSPHPPIRQDKLVVRDFRTGAVVNRIDVGPTQVRSVCVSPDGKLVITAHRDAVIRVWDRQSGEPRCETQSSINGSSIRVFVNATGTRLVAVGTRKVEVYLPDGLQLLDQLQAKSPCLQDDHLYYVDHARPQVIVARNLETGYESDFILMPTEIDSFTISPDGEWLAGVESPRRTVIQASNLKTKIHRQITVENQVKRVRFSPDASSLMISSSNMMEIWDPRTSERWCTISGHTRVVRSSEYIDNETVVTASDDGTVRVWNAKRSQHRWKLNVGRSSALTFDKSSEEMRIAHGRSKTLSSFGETTGTVSSRHQLKTAGLRKLLRNDSTFSADGAHLFASLSGPRNTLGIFHGESGELVTKFPSNSRKVVAVAVDPDMERVACAYQTEPDWHCELVLFRVSDQESIWSTELRMDVRSLALSADKRFIAICGDVLDDEPTVVVWDLNKGRAVFESQDPAYTSQVSFHPTMDWLAATDLDVHELKMIDFQRGESVWPDQPTSLAPADIAFSPNGKRLAVVGYDGNVDLFDSETGARLLVLESFAEPAGTRGFTPRVCFSHDGRRIAANSWNDTLTIWDAGPLASEPRAENQSPPPPESR